MTKETIDVPEIPAHLTTDLVLEAAVRDPRFLLLSDLQKKLPYALIAPDPSVGVKELSQNYGRSSVEKVLALFRSRVADSSRDPLEDTIRLYRAYIRRFNRYGGSQSFLCFADFDIVSTIVTRGSLPPSMGGVHLTAEQRQRAHTARILCLTEADLLDEVLDENPPPEPISETLSEETLAEMRASIRSSAAARKKRKKRRR